MIQSSWIGGVPDVTPVAKPKKLKQIKAERIKDVGPKTARVVQNRGLSNKISALLEASARGWTSIELCEHFNVSYRPINAELTKLEQAGYVVTDKTNRPHIYRHVKRKLSVQELRVQEVYDWIAENPGRNLAAIKAGCRGRKVMRYDLDALVAKGLLRVDLMQYQNTQQQVYFVDTNYVRPS